MKQKIIFLYVWYNPPIRESVQKMLVAAFPEYEVEPLGIGKMLRQRVDWMALNEISVAHYYGVDIVKGKKKHSEYVVATPYLFHQVRRMVLDRLETRVDEIAFTFQLQSLFDTSLPGIPHFVYTDRTVLANLAYPGFDPRQLYARDWIALEKTIYEHADLIFTRSNYINRSLIVDYACPAEKPVCVYVGANTQPVAGTPAPDRYTHKNIVFVGVDWERKGGPDLVQAFQQVLEREPNASLTIIGASPKIDLPQVHVLGQVPLAELSRYYQQGSIFCFPTRNEAFGVALIEAMENGLPIVATNLGAIPDFVVEGENGHLVAPGDSSAIAGALLDLLVDPVKCQAFGEKSRAICAEHYNWDHTGKLIRENVMKTLENRSILNGS